MKEPIENDELWDLLGKSPRTEASPFFVRKVLRAVEAEKSRPAFSLSVVLRWLVPASAAVAVVLGWSAYNWQHQQEVARFNAYFDSVAELDNLVATQGNTDWIVSGN